MVLISRFQKTRHGCVYQSIFMTTCLIAAVSLGCGYRTASVRAPTRDESIIDFKRTTAVWFDRMTAQPATAAAQLDLLLETIEARSQHYGEPFTSYLTLAKETRQSWSGKASLKAVTDGVERLRAAAAQLPDGN
jgi:hypothetical protein